MNFIHTHPYLSIALAAFLVNIPFGFIREGAQKFSLKWFFWIHASIPLLIYMRITLHTSKWFIVPAIIVAIMGQIVGSRYRRKRMTADDIERFEQISDLRIDEKPKEKVLDKDVSIVLMNMGGPENIEEVKPFLLRLFKDDLIIRFPLSKILQPFFAWLIVTIRGSVTEERYKLIGGGSPILKSTQAQAAALAEELARRGRPCDVQVCFNYSHPLPDETMETVKSSGKRFILPLSLYSHYSAATTGSNIFYLKKEAASRYPSVQFLKSKSYYLDDNFIRAFVDRIKETLKPDESLDDFYVLFSAHGLPLYFLTEADPYPFEVSQTVAKVLDRLKRKEKWSISYQSAVGPLQWLKPSTGSVLAALARRGVKKLLVCPISFVTDHIETTCEIDIEYRKAAQDLGITDFRMSKALECHPLFIKALADCVEDSLRSYQERRY